MSSVVQRKTRCLGMELKFLRASRNWKRFLAGVFCFVLCVQGALARGDELANDLFEPIVSQDSVEPVVPPVPPPNVQQLRSPARTEQPLAPPPPPVGPFRPDAVRLPTLASPRGMTPSPTAETLEKFNKYVDRTLDTENTLDLVIGRPRILVFKEAPFRIQLAGENIADYTLITENELSVIGNEPGTTVLNIWFKNEDNPDKQDVLSYLVRVFPDPAEKVRLEAVYAALEKEINRNFPDSVVHLSLVGDRLLIRGQARDVEEATQILAIIGDQAPGGPETIPVQNIDIIATPGPDGEFQPGGLENFLSRTDSRVVNMLRIPGVQQVMLKVTVAEVNRSAARAIGASLSYTPSESLGLFSFAPPAGAAASATASTIAGGRLVINRGDFELAINALKQINLARSLAEPELTTLNGRPANFQVGGSFPVPQITGFTAAGLQGVDFVPFGVQLSFLPVITDKDRVRLNLTALVSARDEQGGTTIDGSNVPGLTQRRFQTTVELREGQTLAVAGLIQNNFGTNSDRVPFAGDAPIIGRLFKQDRDSYDEQELVVLVTPYLVQPIDECLRPPLPGSDLFEPSDIEFFLLGRMQSVRLSDYRTPVRTDLYRMRAYRDCLDSTIPGQVAPCNWWDNNGANCDCEVGSESGLLMPLTSPGPLNEPGQFSEGLMTPIEPPTGPPVQPVPTPAPVEAKPDGPPETPEARRRRLQQTLILGPSGYSDGRY